MRKKDCPLCHKEVESEDYLFHNEIEEVLIDLIKKNHPKWIFKDGACPKCIEYYRAIFGLDDGQSTNSTAE